jgi:hypothetical protein
MGRRLAAIGSWLDRLDDSTLGRFGWLPHQKVKNQPLAHPVRLIVGGYLFGFTLNFLIHRIASDRPLGTSLFISGLIALGPVLPIGIRILLQRRWRPPSQTPRSTQERAA